MTTSGRSPEGDWIDPQGRKVPDDKVRDSDKMLDEVSRRLLASAQGLRNALAAFKDAGLAEVLAAKDLIFEKYGAKIGGAKGNITIGSFDGSVRVQVAVSERLAFGPELQAAKALIDQCIETWAADGGNENIRTLVEHAFQVNKEGRIDTGRVLGLRRLQMTGVDGQPDHVWARAMEAISDAVRVDGSATYLRFYERDDRTGAMVPVPLDFAKL